MNTPMRKCAAVGVRMAACGVTMAGLLAAVGVVGGMPRAAMGQTITAVAPIAGGSITRMYAVNANGTAAAGYSDNAGGQDVAIRWTNTGGTASMGFLPGGSINSYAQAMDNTGTIIAGYGDSGGVTRAFRWTNTGGYQILPYASGTSGFNRANGISGDGSIVTGVSGLGAGANGFTWLASTPAAALNVCAGLGAGNAGLAVSNDGSTIVGTCGTGAIRRTYTPSSVLSGLTAIAGQQWAMAEAVSANGAIITGRYAPSTGGEFGFRYGATVPGFIQPLPQTPSGCTALRPRAVNGDGTVIIGQVVDNTAGFTCFVWTPALGTRLLSDHLTLRGINLAGWTLTDATGISSDGSAMCGNGIFGGQARGWVVRGLTCPSLAGPPALTATGPCIGQNAVLGGFGYSFQNFTTPYFRWFHNGVEIIPGVQPSGSTIAVTNTPNLTITNQQFGDGGSYQVAISAQGACETISTPVTITVPSTITPAAQPADTSACLGQNPSLFATASSPPWGIVHKWQKLVAPPNTYAYINDGPTGNGSTYVGTQTSTFSVLNAQGADSGRYRCEWSFGFCAPSQTVYSNSALFTIIDSLPAIIGPFDTTGCPGDNDAFLSVSVTPCVGCTYQWQKYTACPFVNCFNPIFDGPTGNGGSYGGTGTPNLTVAGLYPGDFTQYRCRIVMPCAGTVFSNEATISADPTPSVNIPVVTPGCQGGTASMSVTASPPGGTYQWQKYVGPCFLCYQNVFNGPTGNGGTFTGAQSPILTINGFDFVDTVTTFRCLVTNGCGTATGASVDGAFVIEDPPLIQTQPVGGKICPNGSKTLSIAMVPGNYGTLSYQWWRYTNAGPIFAPVGNGTYVTGSIASGATTPALTISNFKPGDTGQYYCKVSGDCGFTFSSVVNLTHCPPDYNCDGQTTVSDIFDFLAGWFAGNPNANFNGTGGIDVADIFAFLNAWFAGC